MSSHGSAAQSFMSSSPIPAAPGGAGERGHHQHVVQDEYANLRRFARPQVQGVGPEARLLRGASGSALVAYVVSRAVRLQGGAAGGAGSAAAAQISSA